MQIIRATVLLAIAMFLATKAYSSGLFDTVTSAVSKASTNETQTPPTDKQLTAATTPTDSAKGEEAPKKSEDRAPASSK